VVPFQLPLEETTPVTEAIENSVDEGLSSVNDINEQLERTISIATTGGSAGAYITQASRLGMSVLRGFVSAWSAAIDGLALIAADEVEWWWTEKLEPFGAAQGIVRASVLTVPARQIVPAPMVRVVYAPDADSVQFIDRLPGVPANWDRTCYVAVRQFGGFIPGAVEVTFTVSDHAGRRVGGPSGPFEAALSLPRP
jgi:hypothetical protein